MDMMLQRRIVGLKMPIILECNKCGDTVESCFPDSIDWSIERHIGGTEVRCPKCIPRVEAKPLPFIYKNFNDEVIKVHDIMKAFRKK